MDNYQADFDMIEQFTDTEEKPSIIKIIGVGGGGCNAVKHMYEQGIVGVSYIVCNTDMQALQSSPIRRKIHLGSSSAEGLGAGNDPQKGEEAANESIEEIKTMLQNTKMAFITAGMGGGTGTGAAPVIARTAREMGILTVGIITIPFAHDGTEKISRAIKGTIAMRNNVDAIIVINNENLIEEYPDMSFFKGLKKADEVLCDAAKGIAEIITIHGYINVDFADVDKMLRNGGAALMNSGTAKGANRVQDAIDNALHSPLLKNSDIMGAQRILMNFYCHWDDDSSLNMKEIKQVGEFMKKQVGAPKEVKIGLTADDNLPEGEIKVTIIATGFKDTIFPETDDRSDFAKQGSIFDEEQIIETANTVEPVTPRESKEKKDSNKNNVIPLVVILAILICGIIIFLLYRSDIFSGNKTQHPVRLSPLVENVR